jgi:hypothetical protein
MDYICILLLAIRERYLMYCISTTEERVEERVISYKVET